MSCLIVLGLLAACSDKPEVAEPSGPDLILLNGAIYTMDQAQPWAEALAVKDGVITAVGATDSVRTLAGSSSEVIDLEGQFVMPGINDGHSHPAWGGVVALYYCYFDATASADEVAAKIASCITETDETWIQGGLWTPNFFEQYDIRSPRRWLDRYSGGKAIALKDDSGHNYWFNSRALELLDIDELTEPPAGAVFEKTTEGELNGVVNEAFALINGKLPRWTVEHYREGVRYAVANANSYGVTGFKDASSSETETSAYYELDQAGELTVNVATCLYDARAAYTEDSVAALEALRDSYASAHVHTGFVKIFLDGVPTIARTAAMIDPYQAQPGDTSPVLGPTHLDEQALIDAMVLLDARGFTVKIHTAGDRSVKMALNAIDATRRSNGPSGLRHELAHAGFIAAEDIQRFRALNAVADLSPYIWFPSPIIDSVRKALGERGAKYWPNRDLVDAGAPLLAGSDWPSVTKDLNPWVGMEALITRQDPEHQYRGAGWQDQALTIEEVLTINTLGGAASLGLSETTGSLAVGIAADFILLNHNLLEIPPGEISDTRVQKTWFEGKAVYENRH